MGEHNSPAFWGTLFIGCTGLAAAGIAVFLRLRFARRVRSWRAVSGVIIEVHDYTQDDVSFTFTQGDVSFAVRFTDERGQEHVLSRLRHNYPAYCYLKGKSIPMIYPPDQPEKARPGVPEYLYKNYNVAISGSLAIAAAFLFLSLLQ